MVSINPRSSWGAAPVRSSSTDPATRVSRSSRTGFVVHHSVTGRGDSQADVPGIIRSMQRGHFGRGYSDIGYNYAIDAWGGIWEGRGIDWRGAHAGGANTVNIGVVFIGNNNPTPEAMNSFRAMYAWCNSACGKTLRQFGHRDINSTACPGQILYDWLKAGGLTSNPGPVMLRKGSMGAAVKAWQIILNRAIDLQLVANFDRLVEDGDFGNNTERVTIALQQWGKASEIDGVVGPETEGIGARVMAITYPPVTEPPVEDPEPEPDPEEPPVEEPEPDPEPDPTPGTEPHPVPRPEWALPTLITVAFGIVVSAFAGLGAWLGWW